MKAHSHVWTLCSAGDEEGDSRLVSVTPEHLPEFGSSSNMAATDVQSVGLVLFSIRDTRDGVKV